MNSLLHSIMREFFDAITFAGYLETLSENQSAAESPLCSVLAVSEEDILYLGRMTPSGTPVCRASIGSLAEADIKCGFKADLAANGNPLDAVCKRGITKFGLQVVGAARITK